MRFSAYVVFISLWALVRLQPDRALGVGRRLAGRHGRARLRRRHRRARERRGGRAGRGDRRRQAHRSIRRRRCCRTTCRSRCSAPGCCGSAGSASTPAARWPPARIAGLAFVTTMLAPAATLVVWTFLDADRGPASRPRSARPRRSSSAWSRSRRRPGFISPMSAIALGGIAAVPSYLALQSGAPRRRSTIRSTSSRRTASAARSARC